MFMCNNYLEIINNRGFMIIETNNDRDNIMGFECLNSKCGDKIFMNFDDFNKNIKKCYKCCGQDGIKMSNDDLDNLLLIKKSEFIRIGDYVNTNYKICFKCLNCKRVITKSPKSILKGVKCECVVIKTGRNALTHLEYLKILTDRGIDLIPLENYINSNTKIKHKCKNGNIFDIKPKHVLEKRYINKCKNKIVKEVIKEPIKEQISIDKLIKQPNEYNKKEIFPIKTITYYNGLDSIQRYELISPLSPSKLRYGYFNNNDKNLLESILNNTSNDIKFIERVWLWVKCINEIPKCSCGNKLTFNKNWRNGYREYCSAKCSANSEKTKKLKKETYISNKDYRDQLPKKIIKRNYQNYQNKFNDEFRRSLPEIYLKKYGYDHQLRVPKIKEKVIKTNNERYGYDFMICDPNIRMLGRGHKRSKSEIELVEWLESMNISVEISNYGILTNQEIDIYLKDFKIGIEFNGVYHHSLLYKDCDYHSNKTQKCLEKDIKLIHIYDDEWYIKKNIIKDYISKELKIYNTILMSECSVKIISNLDSINFFKLNSIYESIGFKSYGIYNNEKLISCLTIKWEINNMKKIYYISNYSEMLGFKILDCFDSYIDYIMSDLNINMLYIYMDNDKQYDLNLKRYDIKYLTKYKKYWYLDINNKFRTEVKSSNKIYSSGIILYLIK